MFSTLYFLLYQVEMERRTIREKFWHVVMMVAVVWGILPLLGLLASPPDIKGNRLSLHQRRYIFLKIFQFHFILYTSIFFILYPAHSNVKETHRILWNMTYSNFVQSIPSHCEPILTVIRSRDLYNFSSREWSQIAIRKNELC